MKFSIEFMNANGRSLWCSCCSNMQPPNAEMIRIRVGDDGDRVQRYVAFNHFYEWFQTCLEESAVGGLKTLELNERP